MSTLNTLRAGIIVAATSMIAVSSLPANATPMPTAAALPAAASNDGDIRVEHVQYRHGYAGPRHFGGGPRYYGGGPRYYGGPRFYGGPVYAYRPWYRRPYYGTIIAGVALGTIIGVTAYGLAPRPPRPDLCWYWADEGQSRGYWDYC